MKLQCDKGGRRFFFLTFAVRGRRPVAPLIDEKPAVNYDNCHSMNARNEALCARVAQGGATS